MYVTKIYIKDVETKLHTFLPQQALPVQGRGRMLHSSENP